MNVDQTLAFLVERSKELIHETDQFPITVIAYRGDQQVGMLSSTADGILGSDIWDAAMSLCKRERCTGVAIVARVWASDSPTLRNAKPMMLLVAENAYGDRMQRTYDIIGSYLAERYLRERPAETIAGLGRVFPDREDK